MEHEVRCLFRYGSRDGFFITNIEPMGLHRVFEPRSDEMGGVSGHLVGDTDNLGAHLLKPDSHPSAFEASVARDQHLFPIKYVAEHHGPYLSSCRGRTYDHPRIFNRFGGGQRELESLLWR